MRRQVNHIKTSTLLLLFFCLHVPGQLLSWEPLRFAVATDMRYAAGNHGYYDNSNYFRGVCEAVKRLGEGAFMICPGDLDPASGVDWTIRKYIGESYTWYPVVGNHDRPNDNETVKGENIAWLRAFNEGGNTLPNIVNSGPPGCVETIYSFDYQNVHFAVINCYFDGESDVGGRGKLAEELFTWLEDDLSNTTKEHIFVVGHEPAFPQPDKDNGAVRHLGQSMDEYPAQRNRFWNLCKEYGVLAYICGHTHTYNLTNIEGVWQIQAGHAMGSTEDIAPSTFLMIEVHNSIVTVEVYREIHDGTYDYEDIRHTWSTHVLLETSVALEGPYNPSINRMSTQLNTWGFIPTTSPYPEDPRVVPAIPEDVTDWVLVELRSHVDSSAFSVRSAFLRNDGSIVDDDGTTRQIQIPGTESAYHVVVSHRNHLPVMSREPVQLRYASSELYDFTRGADRYYGSAAKLLNTDPVVYGMFGADISGDGVIRLADELNELRIHNLQFGYINADVDLNGVVSLASELTRVRKNNLQVTKVK